jgi:hypothetical protein
MTGSRNTLVGHSISTTLTTGSRNTVLGDNAASDLDTGNDNIFLGYDVANTNTTGTHNIVIGSGTEVDGANTGTSYRLNIGSAIYGTYGADSTTEGDGTADLTIDGDLTVDNLTLGSLDLSTCTDDQILKYDAGTTSWQCEADGGSVSYPLTPDVAITPVVMEQNTSGEDLIAFDNTNFTTHLGWLAGNQGGGASDGVFIGYNAAPSVTGEDNTVIGNNAAASLTGGTDNTVVGEDAMEEKTGASNNTVVGEDAFRFGTDGDENTVVGEQAMWRGNHSRSVALGRNAGAEYSTAGGAGDDSVFIGYEAGRGNSGSPNTGTRNVYIGSGAASADQDVSPGNVAIGYRAFYRANAGHSLGFGGNVMIGQEAGYDMFDGHGNVFIGENAARREDDARQSVVIGGGAARYGVGRNSVIIGSDATSSILGVEPGRDNVVIGQSAATDLDSDSTNNIIIGSNAGDDLGANVNRTIVIGDNTPGQPSGPKADDYINIASAIYGTYGADSSTFGDGTADLTVDGDLTVSGTFTNPSDIRLKDEIRPIQTALDKVLSLRGVTYTWKGKRNDGKRHMGVIAQEVEEVMPELVHTKDLGGGERMKTVDYQGMVPALIEAIKQQQAQIQYLKQELDALKAAGGR